MSVRPAITATDPEASLGYTGWRVVAAAFAGVMVSFSPIVPYTFSLFLNPLHAAFGWQRAAISGSFALAAITVAVVSPLIGLLLDRFPPRRIILPSILLFALALASLSTLGPDIRRFYLTYFLLGLVANGTAQFAYTRTILTWFETHRGLAVALILTGSGVGSILIPPATEWVIEHFGWRNAYRGLGGIALLGLPLTAFLMRNRPVPSQTLETSQTIETYVTSGATVRSALRSPPFWILSSIIVLSAFAENGLVTNLAAMLAEHGVTLHAAALALSVRGGAGILGRLCTGWLIDRLPAERVQTVILATSALGAALLAIAGTSAVSLVGAALLGIGLGSESDIVPYLVARYFGQRNFSVLYGLTWTAYAIGGATGPLVVGHLFDRAGSYQPRVMLGLACASVLAAAVSLLLRSHRPAPGRSLDPLIPAPISMEE